MQYKTITALFALFVSATMAMPAAAPADAAALEARGDDWRKQYPDVDYWKPYRKDNGDWCQPYDDDYSFSVAYQSSSYVSYSYSYNNGHVKRGGDWRQQYPDVDYWKPYKKDNGDWCRPEDDDYSYSIAYSSSSYVSYSYSYTNGHVKRGGDWKHEYPNVDYWLPYKKDDGDWCRPEDDDFSYSVAYQASSYVAYSYSYNSNNGHW